MFCSGVLIQAVDLEQLLLDGGHVGDGIVTPNWTGPVTRGKSGSGKGERDGRESRQAV
ncbi:hypothetical protein SAMN05660836_02649, partial [Thermodesulforhabdus norvegica]